MQDRAGGRRVAVLGSGVILSVAVLAAIATLSEYDRESPSSAGRRIAGITLAAKNKAERALAAKAAGSSPAPSNHMDGGYRSEKKGHGSSWTQAKLAQESSYLQAKQVEMMIKDDEASRTAESAAKKEDSRYNFLSFTRSPSAPSLAPSMATSGKSHATVSQPGIKQESREKNGKDSAWKAATAHVQAEAQRSADQLLARYQQLAGAGVKAYNKDRAQEQKSKAALHEQAAQQQGQIATQSSLLDVSTLEALSLTGHWRKASVVGRKRGAVQIHYIGYEHKYDEWIEDGSPRLRIVQPPAQHEALGSRTSLAKDKAAVHQLAAQRVQDALHREVASHSVEHTQGRPEPELGPSQEGPSAKAETQPRGRSVPNTVRVYHELAQELKGATEQAADLRDKKLESALKVEDHALSKLSRLGAPLPKSTRERLLGSAQELMDRLHKEQAENEKQGGNQRQQRHSITQDTVLALKSTAEGQKTTALAANDKEGKHHTETPGPSNDHKPDPAAAHDRHGCWYPAFGQKRAALCTMKQMKDGVCKQVWSDLPEITGPLSEFILIRDKNEEREGELVLKPRGVMLAQHGMNFGTIRASLGTRSDGVTWSRLEKTIAFSRPWSVSGFVEKEPSSMLVQDCASKFLGVINMSPSQSNEKGRSTNVKASVLVDEKGDHQLDLVEGHWDVLGDNVDGKHYHIYSADQRLVGILQRREGKDAADWVIQLWLGGPLDPRVAAILAVQLEADSMAVGFSWKWVFCVIMGSLLLFFVLCCVLACIARCCKRRRHVEVKKSPPENASTPLISGVTEGAANLADGVEKVGESLISSVGDGVKSVGDTLSGSAQAVGSGLKSVGGSLVTGAQSVGEGVKTVGSGILKNPISSSRESAPMEAVTDRVAVSQPSYRAPYAPPPTEASTDRGETARSHALYAPPPTEASTERGDPLQTRGLYSQMEPIAGMRPASNRTGVSNATADAGTAMPLSSRPASIFSRIRGIDEPQSRDSTYYHDEPPMKGVSSKPPSSLYPENLPVSNSPRPLDTSSWGASSFRDKSEGGLSREPVSLREWAQKYDFNLPARRGSTVSVDSYHQRNL